MDVDPILDLILDPDPDPQAAPILAVNMDPALDPRAALIPQAAKPVVDPSPDPAAVLSSALKVEPDNAAKFVFDVDGKVGGDGGGAQLAWGRQSSGDLGLPIAI